MHFTHAESLWDREFLSQEQSLAASLEQSHVPGQTSTQVQPATREQQDELARTAGMLVETVRDEMATNSKFENSQFLGLMKQLRDGAVVVDGNRMVEVQDVKESAAASTSVKRGAGNAPLMATAGWASEFRAEGTVSTKGKERAVDSVQGVSDLASHRELGGTPFMHTPTMQVDLRQQGEGQEATRAQETATQEDDLDAYLRKDNESYARYWNDFYDQKGQETGRAVAGSEQVVSADHQSWDRLQSDWDRFEATSTGIRVINQYQFQVNNPYLIGNSSRTKHHEMHAEGRSKGIYEVRYPS